MGGVDLGKKLMGYRLPCLCHHHGYVYEKGRGAACLRNVFYKQILIFTSDLLPSLKHRGLTLWTLSEMVVPLVSQPIVRPLVRPQGAQHINSCLLDYGSLILVISIVPFFYCRLKVSWLQEMHQLT